MPMETNNQSWRTRFFHSQFWFGFKKDHVAQVSALVLVVCATVALLAPVIAPHDPYDPSTIDIMDSELPPSWESDGDERFWLGTDAQGRDLWSAIIYGTRISLTIGICAVLLQAFLGITIGFAPRDTRRPIQL